jgi:hypothetical protein
MSDVRINSAKIVPVILVKMTVGEGKIGDPSRDIFEYWDMDGNLIIHRDPWKEGHGSTFEKDEPAVGGV